MGRFDENQLIIREVSALLSNMRTDLKKVLSANANVQQLHDDYKRLIESLSYCHLEIQIIGQKYAALSEEFEKAKAVAATCMNNEASAYQEQLDNLKRLSKETTTDLISKSNSAINQLVAFEENIKNENKSHKEKIDEIADAFLVLRDYTVKLAESLQKIESDSITNQISQLNTRIEALEKNNESFLQSQRYLAKQIQQTQLNQQESLMLLKNICQGLGIVFESDKES